MTARPGRDRGSATILLMVAVILAGATALAVVRAAEVAVDRARADLVAEVVVAAVAADRIRGLDAESAIARGRILAARDGVVVVRLVEEGDRIEVRVNRHGAVAVAAAHLEW